MTSTRFISKDLQRWFPRLLTQVPFLSRRCSLSSCVSTHLDDTNQCFNGNLHQVMISVPLTHSGDSKALPSLSPPDILDSLAFAPCSSPRLVNGINKAQQIPRLALLNSSMPSFLVSLPLSLSRAGARALPNSCVFRRCAPSICEKIFLGTLISP